MTVAGAASRAAPPAEQDLDTATRSLLDAIRAISSDLDLPGVLTLLVRAAADLTGASYGALGVVGSDGTLSGFHPHGIDAATAALIGAPPRGRGMLGHLVDDPRPLRLADLNLHPASVGMPPHHPPMTTFLGVPIRVHGTVFGNLYLADKETGDEFSAQDEVLVQALANAAGLVIERARTFGVGERRRRWLEATTELSESLSAVRTLDEAMSEIARHALRATRGHLAAAVRFPRAEAPVVALAGSGHDIDLVRRVVAALRETESRTAEGYRTFGSGRALALPLGSRLVTAGVLVVVFDTPLGADVEERELLISFADQAGLALDRIQSVYDRAELAVVSEQDRIARNLHDVVIQRLFGVGMKLQTLSPLGDELDERVEELVADLDQVIREIRSTIFELQSRRTDPVTSP